MHIFSCVGLYIKFQHNRDGVEREYVVCRCASDTAFHQCVSSSASTQPFPDPGSATCLDLQALDVHETRKMRDDSKIHHIVDDLVCRPRKLVRIQVLCQCEVQG